MAGFDSIDILLALLLAAVIAFLYRMQASHAEDPRPELLREEPDEAAGSTAIVETRLTGLAGRLRRAGLDPVTSVPTYWLGKLALAVLLPMVLIELIFLPPLFTGLWGMLVAAVIGFVVPDLWILMLFRRRRARIEAALSHFLDLIVALLRAGLSLPACFRRAGAAMEAGHPLAIEVEIVSRELAAGRDPAASFDALAERTGVEPLRGVAASLGLGVRLGQSIEETLSAQADLVWTRHREAVRRRINLAGVTSIFPVMLCGFPVFFVLVFFPTVLELSEILRDFGRVFE